MKNILALLLCCFSLALAQAQTGDCPYPILFHHGWTGNETTFQGTWDDAEFKDIWGGMTDVFYAMNNATFDTDINGADGILGTSDDDVLVQFVNETNDLLPGCLYAINLDNSWNEDASNPILYPNDGSAIGFSESDSNESAIRKMGYTTKHYIEKVLAANPGKDKVILVGHSMGGLGFREYLQRRTPETPSGTPTWWSDPSQPDGHKVARLVTTTTPHLGSNTMGNISVQGNNPNRDGLPDLNSEAVRDLRYSWSCGFLGLSNCQGAYLYGGDEDAGWGWWNEDGNVDGDESDDDLVGINEPGSTQGYSENWDGTMPNLNLPFPENVHYTWITSDIFGDDGDGVVAWSRQWLYDSTNKPLPSDGVTGHITDTLLTFNNHLATDDEPFSVIRSIDEPDYPKFAYRVNMDINYAVVPTYRSHLATEGLPTEDADVFKFDIPAGFTQDLSIAINTAPNTGQLTVDYFDANPGDFASIYLAGDIQATYAGSSAAPQTLLIPNADLPIGGTAYIKFHYDDVDFYDWHNPMTFQLTAVAPLPLEWLSFEAYARDKEVDLVWKTSLEEDLRVFEIESSIDGIHFTKIGEEQPLNAFSTNSYTFKDVRPSLGTNYYRIKSVDMSGAYEYSVIRTAQLEQAQLEVLKVYPNPTSNVVVMDLLAPDALDFEIHIINSVGQLLQTQSHRAEQAQMQILTQLGHLPNGVYYLFIQSNGKVVDRIRVVKG